MKVTENRELIESLTSSVRRKLQYSAERAENTGTVLSFPLSTPIAVHAIGRTQSMVPCSQGVYRPVLQWVILPTDTASCCLQPGIPKDSDVALGLKGMEFQEPLVTLVMGKPGKVVVHTQNVCYL